MGYWQDNWPGSPAQKQRIFVSRMGIVYTLVVGSAIYFFAPGIKRARKFLEEGNEIYEPMIMQEIKKKVKGKAAVTTTPTREQFMNARREQDSKLHQDFDAPPLPEQEIRRQLK